MNIVGPAVKEIREEKGLTQEVLAARCNILGWDISRSTLAKIEVRLRRVKDTEAVILAQALNVNISRLYCCIDAPVTYNKKNPDPE
ncbi:MAG: helix-turn-helix transcriptional regulator [Porticoccaceae bacterium]|jgi:transcriptional regulator with XRE-family HTH domain|nr:helix-turn-helix transcriptional regulator [Porticoccaceae bacterium]